MRASQYRRVVTNLTCYDVCVLPLLSSLINNLMAHPNSRCITISDSICATRTLSVLASDSTCGKWTQRRGGVNKKSKNVNYLKFSKASLFMGLPKLYSSSLCCYLAHTFFQLFITRLIADYMRVKCSSVSTFTVV